MMWMISKKLIAKKGTKKSKKTETKLFAEHVGLAYIGWIISTLNIKTWQFFFSPSRSIYFFSLQINE